MGAPRVIVAGAGAAGLAAAARLCGRGLAVTLVEARDRLGGRIDTRQDLALGAPVECGAEFVHGRPERTLALARRARASLRVVPERRERRLGTRRVDAGAPFAKAQELLALGERDDEAVAALLRRLRARRRFGEAATALALELARGFYLADPGTASSLALARMTRALEEAGGDVTSRVDGGYARMLSPLVRALRRGEVRLSASIEEIRWRPGHVEVLARGATGGRLPAIRGERAIITLPLPALRARGVRFVPALPEKRRAAEALVMGPVLKAVLRFRRPLWSDEGARRLVFLHVPGAPVPVFWTLAPFRAPLLVGWAGGPDAARLSGKPQRTILRAALGSAARGLGRSPQALEEQLDGAVVVDWARDPFAGGGYAVFPVGSGWASAALARSVAGTLFFAGEATAGDAAGTVEGALRSGERAARELLESI
jgi:monoamine oxidase